jgi:hypothetical protein
MRFRLAASGLATALLVSGMFCASVAQAQVSINIAIGTPPPAPVYEVVPAPRPGFIWAPGYWDWDDHGHKHMWREGHWERDRPGYAYQAPRWVRGAGGWVFVPSRWDERHDRGDWDDHHHGHDHDHDDDRGRYHCPPGHAKKGEC